MVGFLEDLWRGAPSNSCFFLAASKPDGTKWQEWIVHGDEITVGLNTFFYRFSRWDYNLYFCPNPFSSDRRKKEFARPTRVGWCDMDASDPHAYRPEASHIWETSPGRFQGVWLWDGRHNTDEAEGYSRTLAERHGGDSGWTITKMLRVPGSINHKSKYDEPFVKLVHKNWRNIAARPPLPKIAQAMENGDFVNPELQDPKEVYAKYKSKIHAKARSLIRHTYVREKDRSACIHLIVACLFEAGASLDEIACIMWHNPYFIEKHGCHLDRLDTEITRITSKLGRAK